MIYKNGMNLFLFGQMMEISSEHKFDLRLFSELFMVYYQFVDDYENYFMPEEFFEGREPFANDLTEGKYTLPIIHAIKIAGNEEIAGKSE
jgi:geranylgeranyl pyrophosphate synthase